jgi:hypothetical protein
MIKTKGEKRAVCLGVEQALIEAGIFQKTTQSSRDPSRWRISPHPFWISQEEIQFLENLGPALLSFYKALNQLYFKSIKGIQPKWCSAYLDQGKPEALIAYGRMNRFKQHIPLVIRPDLIPTDSGMIATELDSVPGGIGTTACLSKAYETQTFSVVGGPSGMLDGFSKAVRSFAKNENPVLAIVISEESKDYRAEMKWFGEKMGESGIKTHVLEPREVQFSEEGLWLDQGSGPVSIDVCYRFFELFDLMNSPKSELILYSAKKDKISLTPPVKPFLEEKLAFALFHHPVLQPFWEKELGEETFGLLKDLFPKTWVLDPREIPPHAIIPDLKLGPHSITSWFQLSHGTQQERQFVIKPSGFSELAWGSRGVYVGHDLPAKQWEAVLKNAIDQFNKTPYILQSFHKGKRFEMEYVNSPSRELIPMAGRVRLSPYYFVVENQAVLSGILATLCPIDKKLIHGMGDAIMGPCGLRNEN